jgi:XTP/dITP diphosphohydrolase
VRFILRPKLVLATNNTGKVKEFRNLFQNIPFEIVTPKELGIDMDVEENGTTYAENARLKACALAAVSGLLSLADDSGLEVDALNGEPGVMSARYAGKSASDAERVNYLLSKLKNIPKGERTARFRCVIAIASPGGQVEFCEGECNGIIAIEPCGKNGFGYDPIFCFPKYGKTMAELPIEIKNRISHRGRAAQKARLLLENMVQKDTENA